VTDLDHFSATLAAREGQDLFVHCAANKRVSVFVALDRVVRQRWQAAAALEGLDTGSLPKVWQTFIDQVLREHTQEECAMQPWQTVSRRTILDHGRFLTVEEHTVALPDGRTIAEWPWVIAPDYVNVAASTTDGRYICFRQVKYAVPGVSLAPVGGYVDPGEDPLAAAKRELLEETGYSAGDWIDLGHYPVDGNRGVCTAHLYLARGAQRAAEANADDLEEQELVLLTRDQVEAALDGGEFRLLPWAATLALALRYAPEARKEET
jgi:ADP-ribose pyrophosphatase